MRTILTLAATLALLAGAASAETPPASAAAMAAVTRMTEAVNRGDMATVFAAFTPDPVIVEDLSPYRWQGAGAPKAWIDGMGANAQAHDITTINMKLSSATRIDVNEDHAYVVVPGLLSYRMKDGHGEHADGVLTFTLQRLGPDWKIDTVIWSGPVATR